ncbi:MAG TPA: LOG family protein [Ktedonobacteraceae bacterium]|nr:LOG family protein [Ktedonobacteraceae bacterium]
MSDNIPGNDTTPSAKLALEIGVMGSARLTEDDERWKRAHKLGELLAGEGYVVVTGGYGGLMAAASRGAHEKGGNVIGLPMQHWEGIAPNQWNAGLRWSTDYGTRLNHILRCDAVIALPGGVGTLSEMAMVWAASQTEGRAMPLVLLGDCWPPVIKSIRESLVVSEGDMNLLRFAANPEAAVREIQAGLQNKRVGSGPRG